MEIWNKYKKMLIALSLAVAFLLTALILWYRHEGRLLPSFGFDRAAETDHVETGVDSPEEAAQTETIPDDEPAG